MTLVCKSVGIGESIVNPIYGYGVKMAPDINRIYAGLIKKVLTNRKVLFYSNKLIEHILNCVPKSDTCIQSIHKIFVQCWLG